MNKRVYLLLKKFFSNLENRKIRNILQKELNLQEIEQLNKKYNDDIEKVYYNESDIKLLILDKNRSLFTSEEFKYFTDLLELKKFIKK